MSRTKTLIRPKLKNVVLGRRNPQKAEYLCITEDFNEKSLRQILNDGGEQFRDVFRMAEKKNIPHYVVMTANKPEEGLLAVSLLAGIYNEREKRGIWEPKANPDYDPEADITAFWDDDMGWEEDWNRIPVIGFDEAVSYFDRDQDTFSSFQNSFTLGRQENNDYIPYWSGQRSRPVCIRAGWADMNYLERAVTALSSFETNCQVYLLLTKRQDSQWDFLDSFSGDSNQSINGLVLRFTAEEVSVPETRSASRYYGNVWRQMVREAGYKLERGFQVQNLLQEVEKMDQEFSYSLLDQILKYAVRDKENGILRNKDFDFMERFAGKRAANTEQSRPAIQCLKEDLIGLEQVKEQVEETVQVMQFNQIRQKLGIETKGYHNVHLMLGAPGTAKTTVAQIMGRIMAEENLLPGSRFICVNGAELKGMYVGHSAPRTKALFEENDIIVIDEAYSLAGDGSEPDSFSREAIAQLVIELEEHAADKLVIFAGYGGTDVKEKNNKMKAFIDSNPGIKSRINSTFYFASYSPEEMAEIFKKHAGMNGYELPDGWKKVVENYFAERVQDDNFGNGREARSLFEKVSVQMAKRVMRIYGASGEKEARAIEKDDVRRCRLEDIRLAVERSREENTQIAGKEGVRRKIGF